MWFDRITVDEAAIYVGLLLGLVGFFCAPEGTSKKYFRFQREDYGKAILGKGLLAILATIGIRSLLQFGSLVLTGAVGEVPPNFTATNPDLHQLVSFCLWAPFCEELIFRGYSLELFRRWGRLRLGLSISCLLFGLIHVSYGWTAAVQAFLLGAIFCSLRLRRHSLLEPLLVHFLINVYVFADNWLGQRFFTSLVAENARNILLLNIAFGMTGLCFVLIGWKPLYGILRSLGNSRDTT